MPEEQEIPPSRGRKAVSKSLAVSTTSMPDAVAEPAVLAACASSDEQSSPPTSAHSSAPATTTEVASTSSASTNNDPSLAIASASGISAPTPEVEAPFRATLVAAAPPDPLHVAAQEYPWLFMSSTLDACFQNSESSSRTKGSVDKENGDLPSDAEAEQIQFYNAEDEFIKTAPAVMQAFHAHGDTCTRIEAEALKLALHGSEVTDEEELLQVYHDMLDELEKLHAEGLELESSIVELASGGVESEAPEEASESARSQILGVIAACLPVLRARIKNLEMAQELTDSALENLSITLRMESLGIE